VETREGRDARIQLEIKNEAEMTNEDNIQPQQGMDAKDKKGRNASRNMNTETKGQENAVSNMTMANPLAPKRRTSQRVAYAISMKASRDTKVRDYEELDINAIKYIGNW
jgi:hypothetical protein